MRILNLNQREVAEYRQDLHHRVPRGYAKEFSVRGYAIFIEHLMRGSLTSMFKKSAFKKGLQRLGGVSGRVK
ncbi:hypothetical protein [Paraburkholderia sp. DGU8]|uniref:hypothetical protein n=1 Tax=Paraburkholderia sp. DGU8 TaxID=3161997 RepID=UPI003467EB34